MADDEKNSLYKFTEAEEFDIKKTAGNSDFNEVRFIDDFINAIFPRITASRLVCYNDTFYGFDGKISDSQMKNMLFKVFESNYTSVSRKVQNELNLLKSACYVDKLDIPEGVIFFSNGDYYVKEQKFKPYKDNFCFSRLSVAYDENAGKPEKWLNFLSQLLYEEDIKTLQQFIGYSLVPNMGVSTKELQVMLSIIGKGGEGKSVVGKVLSEMFGKACTFGSLQNIEKDFYLAFDIESLLFIDDDLDFSSIKKTNDIKTIISGEDFSYNPLQQLLRLKNDMIFEKISPHPYTATLEAEKRSIFRNFFKKCSHSSTARFRIKNGSTFSKKFPTPIVIVG